MTKGKTLYYEAIFFKEFRQLVKLLRRQCGVSLEGIRVGVAYPMPSKKKITQPKNLGPSATIQNCHIEGPVTNVTFDAPTIEAVKTVAEALQINAEALRNLTKVFDTQGVKVEAMIKIG